MLLAGSRQIGKTWLLKEYGRRSYENAAYFTFDAHGEYQHFFETKDAARFLRMAQLLQSAFGEGKRLFTEFKGALWKITCFSR